MGTPACTMLTSQDAILNCVYALLSDGGIIILREIVHVSYLLWEHMFRQLLGLFENFQVAKHVMTIDKVNVVAGIELT